MWTEKQFEAALRSRRFEAPGVGFAERIIAGAVDRSALGRSLFEALKESAVWVAMQRRPAIAFACVVLIGAFIGLSLPTLPFQQVATVSDEEML